MTETAKMQSTKAITIFFLKMELSSIQNQPHHYGKQERDRTAKRRTANSPTRTGIVEQEQKGVTDPSNAPSTLFPL